MDRQIVPAAVQLLVDLRDALASGNVLSLDECQEVAWGFVACNVVLEMAELFASLAERSDRVVAGNITYGRLYDSLFGDDDRARREIVEVLAAEEAESIRGSHPWSCIHRWLALDPIVSAPDAPQAASPTGIAKQIFLEALACDLSAEMCRGRIKSAVVQFDRWWEKTAAALHEFAGELHRFLADGVTGLAPRLEDLSPATVRRFFVKETLSKWLKENQMGQIITALTVKKSDQLQFCIAGQNGGLERPDGVSGGWTIDVYNKLESKESRGDNFEFRAEQLQMLRKVLAWIEEHGLAQWHGVRLPNLNRIAQESPPVTAFFNNPEKPFSLAAVMYEWDEMAMMLRMRRLPRDWADYPQVSDLFAHPPMGDFRFAAWRKKAIAAGLDGK